MKEQFVPAFTAYHSLNGAVHLAHWNVTGMLFFQFHKLFETIYEILDGQEDGFAEQARGCGIEIPAEVFNSVPEVEWETPKDLVGELLRLTNKYKSSLKELHEACVKEENLGFINLIEGFMTEINSIRYFLKSTLDDL